MTVNSVLTMGIRSGLYVFLVNEAGVSATLRVDEAVEGLLQRGCALLCPSP
jgi:hypothetical protein